MIRPPRPAHAADSSAMMVAARGATEVTSGLFLAAVAASDGRPLDTSSKSFSSDWVASRDYPAANTNLPSAFARLCWC